MVFSTGIGGAFSAGIIKDEPRKIDTPTDTTISLEYYDNNFAKRIDYKDYTDLGTSAQIILRTRTPYTKTDIITLGYGFANGESNIGKMNIITNYGNENEKIY